MRCTLPVVVAFSLVLCACAAGPVYRPATAANGYGYRDSALTDSHYQVSFAGGYGLAQDSVRKFALYRAAQVTLAHGASRFRVVSRQTTPVTTGGGHSTLGVGFGHPFWGLGVGYAPVPRRTRYETVLDIKIGAGVPASGPDVYDAASVVQHLADWVAAANT